MPEPLVSPDGRYALRFTCDQMRMSHCVFCPVLVDLVSDQVLFTLADTMWSAEVAAWGDDSQTVVFGVRRYPGDAPCICVWIDVRQKLVCLDDHAYSLPLGQLYERLEARYRSMLSTHTIRANKQ